MSKTKSGPTDAQIRKRLNSCMGGKPPDKWEWAIKKLRTGKICVIVDRDREVNCIFIRGTTTIEEPK